MDIYSEITNRIIAEMEQGTIPWQKPWVASGSCISYATGKPYSLLNQMILDKPGEYLTFNQIQAAGGRIKKGEKANMVVFWKWLKVKDKDDETEKEIPFLKYFNVFHLDQCEGIEGKHIKGDEGEPLPASPADIDDAAQAIADDYLQRSGVTLQHSEGDRAFYSPATDSVTLPKRIQFASTSEFYSTMFHELTHSTGHSSRLDRLSKVACFGSEEYSKEELVAEIGAATLVNHVGLETASSFRNTAAYVQSWLKVLRNDKRMIVSAAGKAEKAVKLILGEA